jgi:hypothetical protein
MPTWQVLIEGLQVPPERINARCWLWLTLLAAFGISCRNSERNRLDGGAASSSSSALANAATPPTPSTAGPGWAAEQARAIAADPYGDAGNQPDAAVPPSFFGSFSEADVRAAVGRRASPTLRFRIAEWPAHPNQLVALSFQSVPFGAPNKSLEPRVSLLEQQNGVLTRLAEVRIERKKARCSNHFDPPDGLPDDERAPNFKLDLGAYELSRDSSAIGVRYSCSGSWPAADDDEEFLYLLEPVGNLLRQVLEARIGFRNYDRPQFTDTSGVGTVTASPVPGKSGYFDLLLRMKITVENSAPQAHPEPPVITSREETQRFAWDGTRYRELSASPHQ